jgi:predicted O-methyltransferase YrrM
MAKHKYLASEGITEYICSVSAPEHPVLKKCREETSSLPMARMQLGAEQAPLFRVLLGLLNAKKTLEIGVFTGYSSTLTALALPPDGRLIACDMSAEFTRKAREYWREAGVENKIELRLGSAIETLHDLIDEGQAGTFDFAFIDAEKTEYDAYYELSLQLLRPGGLMLFDNTLRGGRVLSEGSTEPDVVAVRALNAKLGRDDRVVTALLPITDGMTLSWKADFSPRSA